MSRFSTFNLGQAVHRGPHGPLCGLLGKSPPPSQTHSEAVWRRTFGAYVRNRAWQITLCHAHFLSVFQVQEYPESDAGFHGGSAAHAVAPGTHAAGHRLLFPLPDTF